MTTFSLPVIPDDVRLLDSEVGRFERDRNHPDRWWLVGDNGLRAAASITLGCLLDIAGEPGLTEVTQT